MSNYYYILSALPTLSLKNHLGESQLDEAWNLIQRNVEEGDLAEINWFVWRNDLYNLLEFWQESYLNYPVRPLRKPYSLTEIEFKNLEKDPSVLPSALREFYESNQMLIPHWSANEMDSAFFNYFFTLVAEKAPVFIRELLSFEKDLRSLMATFNQGLYSFVNKEFKYTDASIRKTLQKEQVKLNSQELLQYPFLSRAIAALSAKDPIRISYTVHEILWEKANELTKGQYFNRLQLLNYCSKLFLIYRREQLSTNQNKPFLKDLVKGVVKSIPSYD